MLRASWVPYGNKNKADCKRILEMFTETGFPSAAFLAKAKAMQQQEENDPGDAAIVQRRSIGWSWTFDRAERLLRDLLRWSDGILDAARSISPDLCVEEQMQLEQHVQALKHFLAGRPDHSAQRVAYSKDQLSKALIASMGLRSKGNLLETVQWALKSFPDAALQAYADHMKLPKSSSQGRHQLDLDAAYCCYWAERRLRHFEGAAYLWLDSSPQCGQDWLLAIVRLINKEDLSGCVENAKFLVASEKTLLEAAAKISSEVMESPTKIMQQTALERLRARRFLLEHVQLHRLIPTGVGKGRAKIEDKCKALARKLVAETQDLTVLRRLLSQVSGFCTDAGVEMSVADVGGVTLHDILADVFPEGMQSEDVFMDLPAADEDSQNYLFPVAVVSPGTLHIYNNMMGDIHKRLEKWDGWLSGLKAVVRIFSNNHVRQRFIGTCILGTDHAWLKHQADSQIPEPASWRWGSIEAAVKETLTKRFVLRTAWNPEKFKGNLDGVPAQAGDRPRDDDLDVSAVTLAVRSPEWWLYTRMILELHLLAGAVRLV